MSRTINHSLLQNGPYHTDNKKLSVGAGTTEVCSALLNKTGKACRCPTPGGSLSHGGWDTPTTVERLKRLKTGRLFFVPCVPPLDSLMRTRACVCVRAKSQSRGGTRGTKSEPPVFRRFRACIAAVVSHPRKRQGGTRWDTTEDIH